MNNKTTKETKLLRNIGRICFSLGILILPSAFLYSSILLLISLIFASIKSENFFKDKWNIPLLICSFLMIFACLITNIYPTKYYEFTTDKFLNWIGLLNWIPMFWVYWSAQYYLKTSQERISCAYLLVLGTIPILISGIGQFYFNWYGPLTFLNNTIIWYQRESSPQVLTGLFNNPNYAGTWLATIFPFSLFFFLKSAKISFKKVFFGFCTFITILSIFLTHSRNAIINFFISFTLLIGISFKTIFLVFSVFFIFISLIFMLEIPLGSLSFFKNNSIINSFIPDTNKFYDIFSFKRIKIWRTAISNIIANPILGWGASSFSIVYLIKNGETTFQHTHNLILEMANNYGIVISLILFTTIFFLMYKSKPNLSQQNFSILDNQLINKFWWVSTLIILLMHLTDITYYDGRISLLFWILISGVRCNLRENNNKQSLL